MCFHTAMILVLPTQCLFAFHSEITLVKIHLVADSVVKNCQLSCTFEKLPLKKVIFPLLIYSYRLKFTI